MRLVRLDNDATLEAGANPICPVVDTDERDEKGEPVITLFYSITDSDPL